MRKKGWHSHQALESAMMTMDNTSCPNVDCFVWVCCWKLNTLQIARMFSNHIMLMTLCVIFGSLVYDNHLCYRLINTIYRRAWFARIWCYFHNITAQVCVVMDKTHDRHLQNINNESASILFFTFTLNMIFINAARSIFKAKTTYGHELWVESDRMKSW